MQYLAILLFSATYGFAAVAWNVPPLAGAVYLVASLLCFALYALDKAAARRQARRTPERTLLLLGLAGGWPGALLAQQWLRHKTVKPGFRTLFWCTVVANVGAFLYLASPG